MSAQLPEGDKLIEIAFVGDEHRAAMIQALLEDNGIPSMQQQVTPSGPQLGYGLMNPGGGSRRVMVHAHRSGEARTILAEIEADYEDLSDPVNAEHLADAEGRGPRGYGLIGAYVRIYAVSLAAIAAMFGAYLLYRAL